MPRVTAFKRYFTLGVKGGDSGLAGVLHKVLSRPERFSMDGAEAGEGGTRSILVRM
jgi:hypothetical protein